MGRVGPVLGRPRAIPRAARPAAGLGPAHAGAGLPLPGALAVGPRRPPRGLYPTKRRAGAPSPGRPPFAGPRLALSGTMPGPEY